MIGGEGGRWVVAALREVPGWRGQPRRRGGGGCGAGAPRRPSAAARRV